MELFLTWVLLGLIGAIVAKNRGYNPYPWAALAVVFGPLVTIASLLLPNKTTASVEQRDRERAIRDGVSSSHRQCPCCAEAIRREATKCRYCESAVKPIPKHASKPKSEPSIWSWPEVKKNLNLDDFVRYRNNPPVRPIPRGWRMVSCPSCNSPGADIQTACWRCGQPFTTK